MVKNNWPVIGSVIVVAALYLLAEFIFAPKVMASAAVLLVGGLVLWRFAPATAELDPTTVIVPYLLTVIAFIAHVYEEYRAFVLGFPSVLDPVVDLDLNTLLSHAAFVSPIVWLAAAVVMLKRWSVGYYLACVFLFGMMFMEPTHFIAPFLADGTWHYVGGAWTAVIPAVLGWYTYLRLRRETNAMKAENRTHA
ncbi:hypothetical protein [Mycobacterium sp. IS-1556]|uniref:hypothetical protein n=1 Tax=Mycobacterium sp. IS-1556 TaxID=1772276 RepID=UPI0007416967|nr:hypothetical protein [Mycobacterium sp. IS-1556]KUH84600.1 hypothetical protein AU187_18765 [Mycobacterium sp. IS-1556]